MALQMLCCDHRLPRRTLLAATASLFLGHKLRGQNPPQPPAPLFSSDVKVVNVFVNVHDKKGKVVKDLTREDFALSEDGRAQTVRYFSQQSDLPLTLGLIVDTTPSESNMLPTERLASNAFLDRLLRLDRDKAFLIQFREDVELLQDLTNSRAKLERALDQLGTDSNNDSAADSPRSGRRGGGPNSTLLSDAIYLASHDVLQSQTGRKALIILADGDHVGSREESAVQAAEHADTLVYCIRIYDSEFGGGRGRGPGGGGGRRGGGFPGGIGLPGGGPWGGNGPGNGPGGGGYPGGPGGRQHGGNGSERSNGKKSLEAFASRTGGAYFEVSKKLTLDQIFAQIEEDLRSQYSLGFTPDAQAAPGYRHLKVDMQGKAKDLRAQSREGYYPQETKPPSGA